MKVYVKIWPHPSDALVSITSFGYYLNFLFVFIVTSVSQFGYAQSIKDSKTQLCPKCMYDPNIQGDDEKMTRVFTNVGKPQFKGSGFYETDYKGK